MIFFQRSILRFAVPDRDDLLPGGKRAVNAMNEKLNEYDVQN